MELSSCGILNQATNFRISSAPKSTSRRRSPFVYSQLRLIEAERNWSVLTPVTSLRSTGRRTQGPRSSWSLSESTWNSMSLWEKLTMYQKRLNRSICPNSCIWLWICKIWSNVCDVIQIKDIIMYKIQI